MEVLTIGSSIMTVNGVEQLLDKYGTAPIIYEGRTYVPARTIFEALSAEVYWNSETRTITGIRGNTDVKLAIGE